MLYSWTGKEACTEQRDVAVVVVTDARPIMITHREDGGMVYAYGRPGQRLLHQTEGFPSRRVMDEWFRILVRVGEQREMHLMSFQLKNAKVSHMASAGSVEQLVRRVCATCDSWNPATMECRGVAGESAPPDSGCGGWEITRRRDRWSAQYGLPPNATGSATEANHE